MAATEKSMPTVELRTASDGDEDVLVAPSSQCVDSSVHSADLSGTTRPRTSQRVRAMPAFGLRAFMDIAARMPQIISLGVGEPDFPTPHHIQSAGQRSIECSPPHTSNLGMIELRVAIAEHLARRYGVRYDPATELLITVGVSEGLQSAALGILNAGDEVIIPNPHYVAYPGFALMASAQPVFVPTFATHGFQVTVAAIEAAITPRTRVILLGYPNNPTGAVMSRERLVEIIQLAEQHDILVFADEIYDRLVYGTEHICVASLPGARERTVLFGGFSKAYAMTGWRIGWLAAPADLAAAAIKVHQYCALFAPTMAQHAALEAIRTGEASVQAMVAEYDRRRRILVRGLNDLGLPTVEPHGAFYAFPQVGHLGLSSYAFAEQLLCEAQVAVIPGSSFGQYGEGYVRACYATSLEKIELALTRIETFLRGKGWLSGPAGL